MNKKIIINENCNGCGLCMTYDFVEETSDGRAKAVGAGILLQDQLEGADEAVKSCPQQAILLEEVVSKSKEEIVKILNSMPTELKLTVPVPKDFPFNAQEIEIPTPYYTGDEYEYKYSSSRQARDAAKEVIRKNMYSGRTGLVQDVIGQFLAANFGSYVEYKESESNFYYSANKKAQVILDKMIGEVSKSNSGSVSEDLKIIVSRPKIDKYSSAGMAIEALTGGLLNAANGIISELSGDNLYSLQSYADDADWDDMEVYTTGAFGRDKMVTKYCYRDIWRAYESIAKDIKSALGWSFNEKVIEPACRFTKNIVENYEKQLIEELKGKAERLKQLL